MNRNYSASLNVSWKIFWFHWEIFFANGKDCCCFFDKTITVFWLKGVNFLRVWVGVLWLFLEFKIRQKQQRKLEEKKREKLSHIVNNKMNHHNHVSPIKKQYRSIITKKDLSKNRNLRTHIKLISISCVIFIYVFIPNSEKNRLNIF